MKYTEGIDRIGLILNPLTFKKDNIRNHKDPYNKLTLHRAGQFFVLSIHEEWFNPLVDYQVQIALAIYTLVKEGFYNIPDTPYTALFIYYHWKYFFLSVVAVEFFSDFKSDNIEIDENMLKPTIDEAREEGGLYRYFNRKNHEYTETYYSPDKNGSRKSLFIHYDKLKKSIKEALHQYVWV
jgi:hypothetical protein